jgi:glycine/D-amino acid oxidase-like deaminating enzyme
LLHPLSPRGKLIHWGLEGLAAAEKLVDTASRHGDNVILRRELYRVALSPQNVEQFQATAERLPELCDWLKAEDIPNCEGSKVLGGLRLSNGCKVIHVPSYLQGLWKACEHVAAERGCSTSWSISKKADVRATCDTAVYAAGNGLFQNGVLSNADLPVQLVRGQSLELRVPDHEHKKPALLCGKYLSPLPNPNLALLGATQEFKETAFTRSEVIAELKKRTDGAFVWNEDQIHRVTTGTRVQSERGKYGRLPIVGRLRENEWMFTGLSSRGLVYHGIYGELLADAILTDSEENMLEKCADLHWWKPKVDL